MSHLVEEDRHGSVVQQLHPQHGARGQTCQSLYLDLIRVS